MNQYLLSCQILGNLGEGRAGTAAGNSKLRKCRSKGCSWKECYMMSRAPTSGNGCPYLGSSKSGGAGERIREK